MVLSVLLRAMAAMALTGVAVIPVCRRHSTGPWVYGTVLAACGIAFVAALGHLLAGAAPLTLTLPLGIPWLGAHFRLDALSAFFVMVINLGGAAASLYAIGYGRHESEPHRILPFYPGFLADRKSVV